MYYWKTIWKLSVLDFWGLNILVDNWLIFFQKCLYLRYLSDETVNKIWFQGHWRKEMLYDRLGVTFIFFFGCPMHRVGSYFPDKGSNLCSLHWKCGVFTGPPVKSQVSLLNNHQRSTSGPVRWAKLKNV